MNQVYVVSRRSFQENIESFAADEVISVDSVWADGALAQKYCNERNQTRKSPWDSEFEVSDVVDFYA